jgi:uncharacterized membrane protein YhaH (DUF805 family)/ribosomal protein L37AE/L43A
MLPVLYGGGSVSRGGFTEILPMNANSNGKSSAALGLQPEATICPKCQYKRTAADQAPGWQCPSCGVAYSKAAAQSAAVVQNVNSARGAGGRRESDDDELETVTPGAISLSFNGRIGRLRYLAYSWPIMVLSGLGMLAAVIPKKPGGVMMLVIPVCILMVLWFWTSLRLMALRLHDVNRSGKWVLALLLLPGLGYAMGGQQMVPVCAGLFWIMALLLVFLPGSEGYNDYGPPAGANTTLVKVGAGIFLALMAVGVVANIKYLQYVRSGKLTPALSGAQGAAGEQPGSGNLQGSKEKALAALRQRVQQISSTLPKQIDAVTTLTKVEVSGDIFKSYYMMAPSVHLDPSRKDVIEQAAKQQICGGSARFLTDNGITVEYMYVFSGPSGPETMDVFVRAHSCL